MNHDNKMIPMLLAALQAELDHHKPLFALRTLSERDRQRQGLALTNARYFIAVLEDHILDRSASVIFSMELTEEYCILRFSLPLRPKEYAALEASEYVPKLRSKMPVSVGLGICGGVTHAYSSVKLSQYGSVVDGFDALFLLGKELEKYIRNDIP